MFFGNLNYIVIIVAAILGLAVSVIWHAPFVFGKLWLTYKGWSDEVLASKKQGKSMIPVYVSVTVATLVQAFIVAVVFNSIIVTGISGILITALCLWAGFTFPVKFADYLFGGDSWQYLLIETGRELVVITLMSLVIALFA